MANYQLTQTGAQVQNLLNDISNKAPKASPALTGIPTAPTAENGTNTTQIATTAFVQTSITDKQDKKPNGTALLIDNSTGKINTAYIPDSLLGALVFGGIITSIGGPSGVALFLTATLTDSAKSILGISNNTCALYPSTDSTSSNIHADDCNNMFFILGVGSNVSFDGLEFNNGDWLIAVNDTWKKIDNTDSVSSVNGKIGSVVLKTSDLQNDSGYLTSNSNLDATKLTGTVTVGNLPTLYWANIAINSSMGYNKTPELANIKLNGNTDAANASTKNAVITYNSTSECVDFIFN